jgi:hypothetical protein
MDLSKSISYRGLELNGVTNVAGKTFQRGIAVETVDYSSINVVGYTEKRAAGDGMHASDVYLGGRSVDMSGFVYATNKAEMFDFLHVLRSVFSPTSAYLDSPGDRGFLPLHYQQSTEDVASFPSPAGVVPLFMNVRPAAPVRFSISRDRQDTSSGLAGPSKAGMRPTVIPWQVQLIAKDPRVYVDPEQSIAVNGAPTSAPGISATAQNRGDYETPLNIMLVIGTSIPPVGAFRVKGLNGIDMSIKIEAVANVAYRWFGDDRVLMTEQLSSTGLSVGNPLVLRMDLVTFATKNRRPMVPASINPPIKPFTSPFTYYRTGSTLAAGSRIFWSEAFA